jgi:hypothetical protein
MPEHNTAITVAIITGAFAIISPIVAYFVKRTGDKHLFQPIPNDRRATMKGHWNGKIEQEFRGHKVTYPGDLQLEIRGHTVHGQLHITLKDGGQTFEATFDMSGGFLHDRFAQLEYSSMAKGSVHFGTMILELSPTATELKGNFVAFGAFSQQIISGLIQFTKSQ